MTKVRIGDIAQKSGVSPTTVSRYFNKPELLSESTRETIKDAIKELNYSQDKLARILVTGNSSLVGVVLPHFHFGFYTELLNQLIGQGKAKGYNFITYTSDKNPESEISMINELISYRIKGLILLSHTLSPEEIEKLPVPVIAIERIGGNFMQINSDNLTGGKLAAELLIKNNCDIFIHINNDYIEEWPAFKRILGFEFAVKNHPYEPIIDQVYCNPYSQEANIAMTNLLTKLIKKYPDKKIGIFCSNDDIANLTLKHCILNQIPVPGQIELIGYDNSPISDSAVYAITSVAQNIPLMAQIALDALDNYKVYESIVPAVLVEKETTSTYTQQF